MFSYVVRRLLYMIPVLLGILVVTFLLFNVFGGDPVAQMVGKQKDPRTRRAHQKMFHLDKPVLVNPAALGLPYQEVRALAVRIAAGGEDGGAAQKELMRSGAPAVEHLVRIVLEEGDLRLAAAASIELSLAAGIWRPIGPRTSTKELESARGAWRAWWEEHREEYRPGFGRRAGLFFDSQLVRFVGQVFTGEFGNSYQNKDRKIADMIADGIGPSLSLSVPAFFFGVLIAIYLAILCAFFRATAVDRTIVVLSVLGMSLSLLVYIIVCQYLLAYRFNWFPVWGYEGGLAGLKYLVLPGTIWVLVALGSDVRFFRTVFLDEINQDYVRTARAKGLATSRVLFKHVLKNALIPIITRLVIAIPFLYTGSLLLEQFFGIPGLGRMTVTAIQQSDFSVVKFMTLVGAVLYMLFNLLSDVLYALVDPRVRLT